jgi:endonuclease/exonuclease/phosphatase family metal-dependent hydrolase
LLLSEKADVVCLAECFPDTIEYLSSGKYPYQLFTATYMVDQDKENTLIASNTRRWGEAILSKYPLTDTQITYLSMDIYGPTNLPIHGTDNHIPALLLANVEINGEVYRLGTVHLTWTPKARMTKRQRVNVLELLELVKNEELVLAGDFNIPRGNEMYKKLLTKYRDNIPMNVVTTLDPELHYRNTKQAGTLKLVVDYVFSTSKYLVSEVRVVSGVSDHCAIVSKIEKK